MLANVLYRICSEIDTHARLQHRIEQDPELFYDYMVTRGGYFYLCGPAGNMPAQMEEAAVNAIAKVR